MYKKIFLIVICSLFLYGCTKDLNTVRFIDYDDTLILKVNVEDGEAVEPPKDPIREGYIFIGWSQTSTNITSDLTIQAMYVSISQKFKLHFNTNNPELNFESKEFSFGDVIYDLPKPTKNNYRFVGWELNGELISDPFTFEFASDVTLTAKWEEIIYIGSQQIQGSQISTYYVPSDVTGIKMDTFEYCRSLKKVYIHKNVYQIGWTAFPEYQGITIYVEAEYKPSGWANNWSGDGNTVIWNYKPEYSKIGVFNQFIYGLRPDKTINVLGPDPSNGSCDIIIPEFIDGNLVTTMAEAAFQGESHINMVSLPKSLIKIPNNAFYKCTFLKKVIIEEGSKMTRIGDNAFYKCIFLKDFEIPDHLLSIGSNAFYETSLTFHIPASVIEIGYKAFDNLSEYSFIFIDVPEIQTGWDEEWNVSNAKVLWDCKSITENNTFKYVIHNTNNITIIGLSNKELINLTIPKEIDGMKVTRLAKDAFAGYLYLTTITFDKESEIKTLEKNTFFCQSLKTVILPNNLEKICEKAFSGFNYIKSIYIPISVIYIEQNAFYGTSMIIKAATTTAPLGWEVNWNGGSLVQWGAQN